MAAETPAVLARDASHAPTWGRWPRTGRMGRARRLSRLHPAVTTAAMRSGGGHHAHSRDRSEGIPLVQGHGSAPVSAPQGRLTNRVTL
jgi:hypothetical protein